MSTVLTERTPQLMQKSIAFLTYLTEWHASLQPLDLEQDWQQRGIQPRQVAMFIVDMVNGFCHEGPLSGPRVRSLIQPIVRVLTRCHELGVQHFLLPQDTHRPDAREFAQFGPHCVAGDSQSETVPELKALPFAHQFTIFEKNSLHPALGTKLEDWLNQHPNVRYFVITGDCTDLCVYQTVMHLQLRANALHLDYQIILPEECVQTYDLPVEVARSIGAMPHAGDLLHLVFLYSMALNGARVVQSVG